MIGAREAGDSVNSIPLSPAVAGSDPFIGALTWGLRPRLYAYACYRRLRKSGDFDWWIVINNYLPVTVFHDCSFDFQPAKQA